MTHVPRSLHFSSALPTTKAMTSKGAKETLVSKLGFKSSSSASKADSELEKVRKENAHLRKKIDEMAKRHIKPPDSDKGKLLEVKETFIRLYQSSEIICHLFLFFMCYFFCLFVFRELFPWRRCVRGTISSCCLKSRSWKLWDSSCQLEEARYIYWQVSARKICAPKSHI